MVWLRLVLGLSFLYLRVVAETILANKWFRMYLLVTYFVWRIVNRGLGLLDIVDNIALEILLATLQAVIE